MPFLPITSIFVAVFSFALVMLSFPVSLQRLKIGEFGGDSADETLRRRIRAQGNFIEYVPLGLIGLAFIEANAASTWLVVGVGSTLVLGRLLHAVGMLHSSAPLRGVGMIFTYLALLVAGGRLFIGAAGSW